MVSRFGKGSRFLLLLASTVIVLAGLKFAASLAVPFLMAAGIATAATPVANWLRQRGTATGAAIGATLAAVMAWVSGFGALTVVAVSDLGSALPTYRQALRDARYEAFHALDTVGWQDAATAAAEADVSGWLSHVLTEQVLLEFPDFFVTAAMILVMTVFILLESTTFHVKLEHASRYSRANFWQALATLQEVQRFLLVKIAVSVATGAAVGLWTAAWGLPHPLLWALLAFVLNFVPVVGSIAAALPAVAAALGTQGLGIAAVVAAGYLAINVALGAVIEPRLVGRRLGLSPLVVVASMMLWWWVLGPMGALLAVPLTMVAKIVASRTEGLRWLAVMLAPSPALRTERRPASERPEADWILEPARPATRG